MGDRGGHRGVAVGAVELREAPGAHLVLQGVEEPPLQGPGDDHEELLHPLHALERVEPQGLARGLGREEWAHLPTRSSGMKNGPRRFGGEGGGGGLAVPEQRQVHPCARGFRDQVQAPSHPDQTSGVHIEQTSGGYKGGAPPPRL